jgi:altronate hydrolase
MHTPTSKASGGIYLIDPRDDVAVATRALEAGESVEVGAVPTSIRIREPIARGHKVALREIRAGEEVHKYGWPIGRARHDIAAGARVHTENLATQLSGVEKYEFTDPTGNADPNAPAETAALRTAERASLGAHGSDAEPAAAAPATFLGYRRANGRVGTRNEIWILTTVGCVNRTAERLARAAAEKFSGRVDGVYAFTHPFGCSQLGEDLDNTRRVLASLITHPNAGGVLVLGLGCESNQLDRLLAQAGPVDRTRIRAFSAQACEDEEEEGLKALEELAEIVAQDVRVPCPLASLVVGLKCGGSDGLSGITANPLVGAIADEVTQAGGAAILTEIPEVFGAEQLLMRRASNRAVFDGIAGVVNRFKTYFLEHGQPVSENPSPGNIEGGITTLEEKSLGAVQKGGRSKVTQVLRYGEGVHQPGLALLEAPGNDAVSSTALVAAGATVLLFTTGRGTPLGFPVPTLKISTNSALAARKPHWIDFDAGRVLAEDSPRAAAHDLLQLVIETASGRLARNEVNGEREIAIWKTGVTL